MAMPRKDMSSFLRPLQCSPHRHVKINTVQAYLTHTCHDILVLDWNDADQTALADL